MADNKCETQCDKINLLNENLKHIMHATYSVEPAMLGWETIYALIEGQLIIAYFGNNKNQLIILAGLFFALSWVILVDMNHKHQIYRSKAIENLEAILKDYYKNADLGFYKQDICAEQKLEWRLLWILPVKWIPESMQIRRILTSTWTYRKLAPILLILFWILIYKFTSANSVFCYHR